MKKQTLVIALAALACSVNVMAMTNKHKQDCQTCHVNGMGSPVTTQQCQTCHSPDAFPKEHTFKDGSANPHANIHYAPETVDCALCHNEHKESRNYCQACHADGLGFKVP